MFDVIIVSDFQTASSVLNTTYECEPSVDLKSEEEVEIVVSKPPVQRRLRSSASRRALAAIQDESVRSSDEFEMQKSMRKSMSVGALRKKTSHSNLKKLGSLKKKSSASDISVSDNSSPDNSMFMDEGVKKKRKLYKPTNSFFGPPE